MAVVLAKLERFYGLSKYLSIISLGCGFSAYMFVSSSSPNSCHQASPLMALFSWAWTAAVVQWQEQRQEKRRTAAEDVGVTTKKAKKK